MMPILLYSLNSTCFRNEQLLLNSLKSVEILINESVKDNGEYFIQFIDKIIERLVDMTVYQESMDIRLLALKCVNNLAKNISPGRLIKHQHLVCKCLVRCLSDKKRLCRQLAVEA